MSRVVVTGIGFYSPLGSQRAEVMEALKSLKNAVMPYPVMHEFKNAHTFLAAPMKEDLQTFPRKTLRTCGRVGALALSATANAILDSGLDLSDLDKLSCGIAYGSSTGSNIGSEELGNFEVKKDVGYLKATTYPSIMPHQTAVNIAMYFGIHGRIIATSTACTSGSQAIGYAYETIKAGNATVMLAGGAEELSPYVVGVFDALFATSLESNPLLTPRPFDKNRDGLIIGEGAGTLVLEDYEHAKARGAHIYAEITGFATNCDATHITNPQSKYMEQCMRDALANARLTPADIGYINAHGTATLAGDMAEGSATFEVFKNKVPVSSLKSYMGHTLGAAGALEAIMTILMQHEKWFCPTINLLDPDPKCGELDFIMHKGLVKDTQYTMSNNFAFGGVNTALIFKQI